ncbi:MAG TPA: hypothetical protein ENI94_12980 [Gammaproteobacteria bacterium]|nr:hypothetical protein [Gammaproteobacteria bacterium]
MTLDDLYLALHRACRAHDGGIRAIARQIGRREKTLYSQLDPHDETHEPGLGALVAILQCLDAPAQVDVLDALVGIFGYGLATRTKEQAGTVVQAVLHAVREHADIAAAVESALANDGRIDSHERAAILRECTEARRAIHVLENTLTGENE